LVREREIYHLFRQSLNGGHSAWSEGRWNSLMSKIMGIKALENVRKSALKTNHVPDLMIL
jgi:hypothetical protein